MYTLWEGYQNMQMSNRNIFFLRLKTTLHVSVNTCISSLICKPAARAAKILFTLNLLFRQNAKGSVCISQNMRYISVCH